VNCEDARELISAYLDGELDERTTSRLMEHIEKCVACQKLLHDLSAVISRTAGANRFIAPSDLAQETVSRIEREVLYGPDADAEPSRWPRWITMGAVAAAAVVLVFGAHLIVNQQRPKESKGLVLTLREKVVKREPPVRVEAKDLVVAQAEAPAPPGKAGPEFGLTAASSVPADEEALGRAASLDKQVAPAAAAPIVKEPQQALPRAKTEEEMLAGTEAEGDATRRTRRALQFSMKEMRKARRKEDVAAGKPEEAPLEALKVPASRAAGEPNGFHRTEAGKAVLADADRLAMEAGGTGPPATSRPSPVTLDAVIKLALDGRLPEAAHALERTLAEGRLSDDEARLVRPLVAELSRQGDPTTHFIRLPAELARRARPEVDIPVFLTVINAADSPARQVEFIQAFGQPTSVRSLGENAGTAWTFARVNEPEIAALANAAKAKGAPAGEKKAVAAHTATGVTSVPGVAASQPWKPVMFIAIFRPWTDKETQ